MKALPSCSFPTNVVVIDDRVDFLKTLSMMLSANRATYSFYNKPGEALTFLNEGYQSDPFTNRWVDRPDEEEFEHRMIDVNIRELHREIYNQNRFKQISTVVVDYDMPGMTGLEVCEKIKVPHIQKILLTGAADEQLAVEAFNKGLIHQFIRKQNKNVSDALNKAIKESQHNYFLSLSSVVTNAVTSQPDHQSALSDPGFIDFFMSLVQDNDIAEYYLCEGMGTFLLLDNDARASGLFTYVKEQLEPDLESEESESVPPKLLADLKAHRKILCYHSQRGITIPDGREWEPYVFPANTLKGRETYYYAFAPNMFDINSDKIVSFNTFKEQYMQKTLI